VEPIAHYTFIASILLLLLGWLWLLGIAFSERLAWGLGVLFFPPTALVFIPLCWKRTAPVVALFLIATIPLLWALHMLHSIDLGPRYKIVDGEPHLTLTGWDRRDYSLLLDRPGIVVLQMANPDVTDSTLRYLVGLKDLRELDLDNTQVTDAGLAILAELPRLERLRLARTSVTDEGFRKHLADKDSLLELYVRGTKVASKSLREWKVKHNDKRRYVN
jgi:hypothetical protein